MSEMTKIEEDKLKQHCYQLYKIHWLKTNVGAERFLSEYFSYLLEKEGEGWEDSFSFEDYLFEYGFGGAIYVCFDEFLGAEFLDEEFMEALLAEDSEYRQAYFKWMHSGEGCDEGKINPSNYTIEYCPFCDSEQVIYAKGITACPECGKPLAPCSMCEECNYATCPYGCTGGVEDEHKEVTNPPISRKKAQKIYGML